MVIFADTSGLYPLLDAENMAFESVAPVWEHLRDGGYSIVTTNYVLVETATLLQSRLGVGAVRDFVDGVVPVLSVEWVDPRVHEGGLAAVLAANRRDLSFVDCVSFEVMRRLGIRRAFALDGHFREQGFECVPQTDL